VWRYDHWSFPERINVPRIIFSVRKKSGDKPVVYPELLLKRMVQELRAMKRVWRIKTGTAALVIMLFLFCLPTGCAFVRHVPPAPATTLNLSQLPSPPQVVTSPGSQPTVSLKVRLPAPESRNRQFGVNMAPLEMRSGLDDAENLGIGMIRVPLSWQTVEPEKGEFDWAPSDLIVRSARDRNMSVLFTLRSISKWGTKKTSRQTSIYTSGSAPKDPDDWSAFAGALADHYKGQGISYEIENEVNAPAFWDGSPEEYADLLKASYTAIKEKDPAATVLPSAMACGITRDMKNDEGTQEQFLNNYRQWLLPALSTKSFDAVNVHDYYFPDHEVNEFTFRTYLDLIHDVMGQAGAGDRPVWITETGYISQPADVGNRRDNGSFENQIGWLEQSCRQAGDYPAEKIFWLILRDRDEAYFGSMGLSDRNGLHKPAWNSLKKIIRGQE
jgi:hypothetical protein